MWAFTVCFHLKALLQILHWKGLSSLWLTSWEVRSRLVTNVFGHWRHWYGFSPVCLLLVWATRIAFSAKDRSHSRHWYFFSRKCTFLTCVCTEALCLNAFPHILQLWALFSLCTSLWAYKLDLYPKADSQRLHLYLFPPPVCLALLWLSIVSRLEKSFSHSSQGCRLQAVCIVFTRLAVMAVFLRFLLLPFSKTMSAALAVLQLSSCCMASSSIAGNAPE